jgi:chemotaxis-related protein WspD
MNTARAPINDCWNRIGVRGDGSCAELRTHVHCRNCPVHAAAARELLDVPLSAERLEQWTKRFAEPRQAHEHDTQSALIFRCSSEWLGLPTALCSEVASIRVIRSLPHRRDRAVLGLANVRGELIVCVSLGALLGLQAAPASSTPRLLIVKGEGEPTALSVDEIHGTYRYSRRELLPVPDTVAAAAVRSSHSTLRWRDRTVGLLDGGSLLASLDRCVA